MVDFNRSIVGSFRMPREESDEIEDVVEYKCMGCDKYFEAEEGDFDPIMHYCGGSPGCAP